jgi:hypothetical protein
MLFCQIEVVFSLALPVGSYSRLISGPVFSFFCLFWDSCFFGLSGYPFNSKSRNIFLHFVGGGGMFMDSLGVSCHPRFPDWSSTPRPKRTSV